MEDLMEWLLLAVVAADQIRVVSSAVMTGSLTRVLDLTSGLTGARDLRAGRKYKKSRTKTIMTRMISSAAAMSDDTSVVSPPLKALLELWDQFWSVQANWSTRMLVPRRDASTSVSGVLARFHRPLPTGCTEYDTCELNQ